MAASRRGATDRRPAPRLGIRRFRPGDMRRVLELEAVCFPTEAYPREMFEDLHRGCGEMFFVAHRGARVLGYIVSCVARKRAEIVSFAVEPRSRREGVGTAMMTHTLEKLRRAGVREIWLSVRATSGEVIRLYRWFGFRRVARVARYYQDGGDALRMRLLLE